MYLAAVLGGNSLNPSVGSSSEVVEVEKGKAREEEDVYVEEDEEDWTFFPRDDASLCTGPASSLASNARLWPWFPEVPPRVLTAPNSPSPVFHQKLTKRPRPHISESSESRARSPRTTQGLIGSESEASPIVSKNWSDVIPLRASQSPSVSYRIPSNLPSSGKECTIIDLTEQDDEAEEEMSQRKSSEEHEPEWMLAESEESSSEASFATAPEI